MQISCAVTAQLIGAFVFAAQIATYMIYPKLQASSLLLRVYKPVCVGPGWKPEDRFSSVAAQIISYLELVQLGL